VVACYLQYYTDGTVFFGAAERFSVDGERMTRLFHEPQAVLSGHGLALEKMKQIGLVDPRRAIHMGFNLEKMVSRKSVKLSEE
jgi:hypothetical protein